MLARRGKTSRTRRHGELLFLRNANYANEHENAERLSTCLRVIIADQHLDESAWYCTEFTLLAAALCKASQIPFSAILLTRTFLRCVYKTDCRSPNAALCASLNYSFPPVGTCFCVLPVSDLKWRRKASKDLLHIKWMSMKYNEVSYYLRQTCSYYTCQIIVTIEFNDLAYSNFGHTSVLYCFTVKYIKVYGNQRRSLNKKKGPFRTAFV